MMHSITKSRVQTAGLILAAAAIVVVGAVMFASQTSAQSLQTGASLTISKTDSKTSANPGDVTTYVVTIANSGDTAAAGVQVKDALPGNYGTIQGVTDGGSLNANVLTFDNLTIPGHGSKTVSFSGTIGGSLAVGTTTLTNTATLGCSSAPEGRCPYTGTATDTTTVKVEPVKVPAAAALTLSKSVNINTFTLPGNAITYTVTVTNNASATDTARNVKVTDTLPAGFTFTADGTATGTFVIGDLVPGQNSTLTYDVKVGAAVATGTYENTAVAKADNTEQLTVTAPVEVRAPIVLGETTEEETPAQPKVQVLAETGTGFTDYLIAFGALVVLAAGFFGVRSFATRKA